MNNNKGVDVRECFYNEVKKGQIGPVLVDDYHYCDDNDKPKEEFYLKYEPNELEKKKTEDFRKRLIEFIIQAQDKDHVDSLQFFLEGDIKYKEGFGYISVINPDRDIVDIYFYGQDEDTAFTHAITSYMWRCGDYFEYNNRAFLAEDFRQRFPDDVREDNYYGPFYFIEYALSKLNIYFKGNIPPQIKTYLEGRLGQKWQFDYEQNCIVKKVPNMEHKLINPENK